MTDPRSDENKQLSQNSPSRSICAMCKKSYERLSDLLRKGNYAPFCSRGCAAKDQLNWLNGHYLIKDNGQLGYEDDVVVDEDKDKDEIQSVD
jgi:endogenous inhibitor of DNA gyrase (YacG/DUF329 family)